VKKRLVVAIAVVVAVLTMAVPAGADGYPPSDQGAPPASAPSAAPSQQAPTGALPRTGDDSSLVLARGAAILIAVGGVLVLAVRRRRASIA
jgi:LPXTG-motif cell wall-anchored protein